MRMTFCKESSKSPFVLFKLSVGDVATDFPTICLTGADEARSLRDLLDTNSTVVNSTWGISPVDRDVGQYFTKVSYFDQDSEEEWILDLDSKLDSTFYGGGKNTEKNNPFDYPPSLFAETIITLNVPAFLTQEHLTRNVAQLSANEQRRIRELVLTDSNAEDRTAAKRQKTKDDEAEVDASGCCPYENL